MEEFKKLGIGKEILEVIAELGFEKPSEIQMKTIPLVVKGKDVIGNSATGSGKTLAFGAAIIEKAEKGKGVQALVLTPTRELAVQVAESLRMFSAKKRLKVQEVYGGVGMGNQVLGIETAEIIVGTPGRLLDHLRHGTLKLNKVKVLVLDEADRMVDMGFLPDVEEIIKQNPADRQTLLFSATNTGDVDYIAKKYMKNPEHVEVESFVDPSKLNQIYYDVETNKKFSLLLHLLKNEKSKLAMVFCNTQRTSDSVARNLEKNKIDAVAIHGGLSQARRTAVMEKFHAGKVMVLVCTDVAARGLHIENVSHIYNYDIPKNSNDYIHRIGRTARAGKSGAAISLVTNRDYMVFSDIQNEEGVTVANKELPQFEEVYAEFGGRGGFGGSRGGGRDSYHGRQSGGGFRGGGFSRGRGSDGGFRRGNFGGNRRGFGGGFNRRERGNSGWSGQGSFGEGRKRGFGGSNNQRSDGENRGGSRGFGGGFRGSGGGGYGGSRGGGFRGGGGSRGGSSGGSRGGGFNRGGGRGFGGRDNRRRDSSRRFDNRRR